MLKKEEKPDFLFYIIFFIILAAAIYIRAYNLGERSLWLDEAWLANAASQPNLNQLIEKSFHAPLFFTMTLHFMTKALGHHEFIFRLLPFLFGIGTLFLFYLVIRKHIGKTAILVCLIFLSFSPNFIHFSKELKQYSGAMFFAVLMVYLCEKVIIHQRTKDWLFLGFVSMLGIGFDHSVIFVLPALFCSLLIALPLKKFWKNTLIWGASVGTFTLVFFFFHLRHQITESLGSAQKYWLAYYPKLSSFTTFTKWFISHTENLLNFLSFPYFAVSLIVIILGLSLFYAHSQKRFILYSLLPVVLVLGASFLKRYPYGGSRLMLFVAPLLYLPFGKGLDFIFLKLKESKLYIPLILIIIFLIIPPISHFAEKAAHPLKREEMRPLLNKIENKVKPNDKIYVYYGAGEAFKFYYKHKFHEMIHHNDIIWGGYHRNNIPQYSSELDKYLRKNMRIWVIFSHYREKERVSIIQFLKHKGKLIQEFHTPGTLAYLFKIQ